MLTYHPLKIAELRPEGNEAVCVSLDVPDELREAAREGEWNIDWQPLDESCRQAEESDTARDFAAAVRHYCRAISHMMNELRSQSEKKTRGHDDS